MDLLKWLHEIFVDSEYYAHSDIVAETENQSRAAERKIKNMLGESEEFFKISDIMADIETNNEMCGFILGFTLAKKLLSM